MYKIVHVQCTNTVLCSEYAIRTFLTQNIVQYILNTVGCSRLLKIQYSRRVWNYEYLNLDPYSEYGSGSGSRFVWKRWIRIRNNPTVSATITLCFTNYTRSLTCLIKIQIISLAFACNKTNLMYMCTVQPWHTSKLFYILMQYAFLNNKWLK